jgi:GGDEF domain-containing protein
VLLDRDHFKKINDRYGHQGGDEVLRAFARSAASSLRESDALYRPLRRRGVRGHPSLLRCRGSDDGGQAHRREGRGVARHRGWNPVSITTSAGVACLSASDDEVELPAEADAALYDAKRKGRNQARAR